MEAGRLRTADAEEALAALTAADFPFFSRLFAPRPSGVLSDARCEVLHLFVIATELVVEFRGN